MSDNNKTYRIRTEVGKAEYFLPVQIDQDYDILEILSLKIDTRGAFNLHSADYGVVVGRVIANGGVGVPNARVSIFIPRAEDDNDNVTNALYPYVSYRSKNTSGIRYNLLTDTSEEINSEECHRVVGTFPSKKLVLDDDNYVEIFEKYYKYVPRTNDSGDYMLFGIPTGIYKLHMDLDISDCGILSQRPRDFVYKGYNIEQFENPNQFKVDTELDSLSHIFSQNQNVDIRPFWGDTGLTPNIGITRADVNVNFKFETTCVFMGSVFTDDPNHGISKKCVPTKEMGKMNKLTTSMGTIEIIRKTPSNAVEELNIKGTELIDGNGVWCFQIPMNLDYMMTDEYGNLVATDDPNKGIATRARVRFRMSMGDDSDSKKFFQTKVLVPNNPQEQAYGENSTNYTFGTNTSDSDFRDLFWNGVYSVKSYIPRIQYPHIGGSKYRTQKFSGIKTCNAPDANNPFPFNHIRLRFPFLFVMVCALVNMMIGAINIINQTITTVNKILYGLNNFHIGKWHPFQIKIPFSHYITVSDTLCPEMSGTYVAPGAATEWAQPSKADYVRDLIAGTYKKILVDDFAASTGNTSYTVGNGYLMTGPTTGDGSNNDAFLASYVNASGQTIWGFYYENQSSGKNLQKRLESFMEGVMPRPSARTFNAFFSGNSINKQNMKGYAHPDGSSKEQYGAFEDIGDKGLYERYDTLQRALEEIRSTMPVATSADIQSTAYKNSEAGLYTTSRTGIGTEDEQETICLTTATTYLMECVEMHLAEEYEVINFDFYNDWINGSIYMPRWAREVRAKASRGNTIKGCFNASDVKRLNEDSGTTKSTVKTSKRTMYLTTVGGMQYSTPGQDVIYNAKTKWNSNIPQVPILGKQGGLVRVIENQAGLKAYYFKPSEWDTNGKKYTLFATDIILLGHLDACNIFSIPQITNNLDATSYKLPPDLVETNLMSDGMEYKAGGCFAVEKIDKASSGELFATFANGVSNSISTEMIVSGQTVGEELVSVTEEAGISWSITGPNQLFPSKDGLYAPGGHFLSMSCIEPKTSTNIKSLINAARMCEIGVTDSERIEIETKRNDENAFNYFVPTGFISKDEITDDVFRSQFATLNINGLKTKIDPITGYLRYDFRYLQPMNFDGAGSKLVSSVYIPDEHYRYITYDKDEGVVTKPATGFGQYYNTKVADLCQMAHTPYYKDNVDLQNVIDKEEDHTYTRTWESWDEDYHRFRFGITTNLSDETRARFTQRKGNWELPQYENSFYFYFGLKQGNTAVDKLNSDFFAVCAPKIDLEYTGQMIVDKYPAEYQLNGISFTRFDVELRDITPEYTIEMYEGKDATGYQYLHKDDIFKQLAFVLEYQTFNSLFPATYNGVDTKLSLIGLNAPDGAGLQTDGGDIILYNAPDDIKKLALPKDSARLFSQNKFSLLVPATVQSFKITNSAGYAFVENVTPQRNIFPGDIVSDYSVTEFEVSADTMEREPVMPKVTEKDYGILENGTGGYITFDINDKEIDSKNHYAIFVTQGENYSSRNLEGNSHSLSTSMMKAFNWFHNQEQITTSHTISPDGEGVNPYIFPLWLSGNHPDVNKYNVFITDYRQQAPNWKYITTVTVPVSVTASTIVYKIENTNNISFQSQTNLWSLFQDAQTKIKNGIAPEPIFSELGLLCTDTVLDINKNQAKRIYAQSTDREHYDTYALLQTQWSIEEGEYIANGINESRNNGLFQITLPAFRSVKGHLKQIKDSVSPSVFPYHNNHTLEHGVLIEYTNKQISLTGLTLELKTDFVQTNKWLNYCDYFVATVHNGDGIEYYFLEKKAYDERSKKLTLRIPDGKIIKESEPLAIYAPQIIPYVHYPMSASCEVICTNLFDSAEGLLHTTTQIMDMRTNYYDLCNMDGIQLDVDMQKGGKVNDIQSVTAKVISNNRTALQQGSQETTIENTNFYLRSDEESAELIAGENVQLYFKEVDKTAPLKMTDIVNLRLEDLKTKGWIQSGETGGEETDKIRYTLQVYSGATSKGDMIRIGYVTRPVETPVVPIYYTVPYRASAEYESNKDGLQYTELTLKIDSKLPEDINSEVTFDLIVSVKNVSSSSIMAMRFSDYQLPLPSFDNADTINSSAHTHTFNLKVSENSTYGNRIIQTKYIYVKREKETSDKQQEGFVKMEVQMMMEGQLPGRYDTIITCNSLGNNTYNVTIQE